MGLTMDKKALDSLLATKQLTPKPQPVKVRAKINVHNEFRAEVHDSRTGELKQVAFAYNIVLTQMFTRLCTPATYFTHIGFGRGAGVLDAARTSLFNRIATLAATTVARTYAYPISSWQSRCILGVGEYWPETITEVGIAFGTAATNFVTHAFLEDAFGNPISIIKGEFDIITLYATVYIDLGPVELLGIGGGSVRWMAQPLENEFIRWLAGAAPTTYPSRNWRFGSGRTWADSLEGYLGLVLAGAWVGNPAARTLTSPVARLPVGTANGPIRSFMLGDSSSNFRGSIHAMLPIPLIYLNHPIVGEVVGAGDGVTTDFDLVWNSPIPGSVAVEVDGVPTAVTQTEGAYIGTIRYQHTPRLGEYFGYKVQMLPGDDGVYVHTAQGSSATGRHVLYWLNKAHYSHQVNSTTPGTVDTVAYGRGSSSLHPTHNYVIGVARQEWGAYTVRMHSCLLDKATGVWGGLVETIDLDDFQTARLDISPSGLYVVVTKRLTPFLRVYPFDPATGTFGAAIDTADAPTASLLGDSAHRLAWSPCGNYIAAVQATSPYINVWEFDPALGGSFVGKLADPLTLAEGAASCVAWSPDGLMLLCGHAGGQNVSSWDFDAIAGTIGARTVPDQAVGEAPTCVAVSPNNSMVAIGTVGSPYLHAYNFNTATGVWGHKFRDTAYPAHVVGHEVLSVAWSAGSDFIISGIDSGRTDRPNIQIHPVHQSTSRHNINFAVAPPLGHAIVADYDIPYIPKDINHVLDVQVQFIFG